MNTVLQIVPQLPETYGGVGDYAFNLADKLLQDHHLKTVFAFPGESSTSSVGGFEVRSGANFPGVTPQNDYDHVILHYVNYGYQNRGVPFRLRTQMQRMRGRLKGRWITMFHELYASGAPWKSAFWLRPLQVRIARDMVDLSDCCFVSNRVIRNEITSYDSTKRVGLQPIMSNLGEPVLEDFTNRSARNWVICGRLPLILRSLRTFAAVCSQIPRSYCPDRLDVVGGERDEMVSDCLFELEKTIPGIACHYHPEVSAQLASEILRECTFGWLDYFGDHKSWPGMIFKSGSFAAFCAHGIIPVLAHQEPPPSVDEDSFPGLFSLSSKSAHLPSVDLLSGLRQEIYDWYHKHASAKKAAIAYADALK